MAAAGCVRVNSSDEGTYVKVTAQSGNAIAWASLSSSLSSSKKVSAIVVVDWISMDTSDNAC